MKPTPRTVPSSGKRLLSAISGRSTQLKDRPASRKTDKTSPYRAVFREDGRLQTPRSATALAEPNATSPIPSVYRFLCPVQRAGLLSLEGNKSRGTRFD